MVTNRRRRQADTEKQVLLLTEIINREPPSNQGEDLTTRQYGYVIDKQESDITYNAWASIPGLETMARVKLDGKPAGR